jgi:hypothetical protein
MLSMIKKKPAMLSDKHAMQASLTINPKGSLNDYSNGETKYKAESNILINNHSNQVDSVSYYGWENMLNNVGRYRNFNR